MLGGALAYLLGVPFVAPVALLLAPLVALLAVHRPGRRDALLATIVAAATLWLFKGTADQFGWFEAAWTALLTGAVLVVFGLKRGAADRPIASALLATGLAAAAGVVLIAVTSFSFGELQWLGQQHFGSQARALSELFRAAAEQNGGAAAATAAAAMATGLLTGAHYVALLLPGLILLQSAAALALAWSLYRALAREPEGAPLPALKEFRFNDHLIWGVVAALLGLVLPSAASIHVLGGNLAAFFGGLYLMRGLGVLAALFSGFSGLGAWLFGLFVVVFLAPLALLGLLVALALGVSDTWVDWRRRAAKAR